MYDELDTTQPSGRIAVMDANGRPQIYHRVADRMELSMNDNDSPTMSEARRRELLNMTPAGAAVLAAEAEAQRKAGEAQGRAFADSEIARRERLAQINSAYR